MTNTYNFCALCGHGSYDLKDFVSVEEPECICENTDACARRQKRNEVLADIQRIAKKPARNRTNDALLAIVLACGVFLGGSTAIAISWLISVKGF